MAGYAEGDREDTAMMARRRFCSLVALFLLLGLQASGNAAGARAADGQPATVHGVVLNGSMRNRPVSGQTLTLTVLGSSGNRALTTATSDASGAYRFSGINPDPTATYQVTVSYAGVSYQSQPLSLVAGATAEADVTVYETTESGAAISVQRLSLVFAAIDEKRQTTTVVEVYHFVNSGQQTYIGRPVNGQRQTLDFPLFAGGHTLIPEQGFNPSEINPTATGFALSTPVPPGEFPIAFSYEIPYRGSVLSLARSLAYPTTLFEVLPPPALTISSPQLTGRDQVQIGSQTLSALDATDLQSGSAVEIRVAGLPAPASPIVSLDSLRTQLVLVGAVALAAVAYVAGYRYRKRSALDGGVREQLLSQIAELDDRSVRGEIADADYRAQRGALKQQLRREVQLSAVPPRLVTLGEKRAGRPKRGRIPETTRAGKQAGRAGAPVRKKEKGYGDD